MKLKILGIFYDIMEVDKSEFSDDTTFGKANSKTGKIWLSKGMPGAIRKSTLFHEIIHIINDNLGLGLTEKQVLGLETGLREFFKVKLIK